MKRLNKLGLLLEPSFYLQRGYGSIAWLLSKVLAGHEAALIKKYANVSHSFEPVFIVGAPRTGSTILYQALTNSYDFLYIDNVVDYLYRNVLLGFWLSDFLYKGRAHNNFKSSLGNTRKYGLRAPSESGRFWYRWFPRENHFLDFGDVDNASLEQIQDNLSSVMSRFSAPLLFKNLNMGQRLRPLSQIFPNAKIIFCKRSPYFVVQSLINAREKLGIGSGEWWSVKPSCFEALLALPEDEMLVKQVYELEKQIYKDLSLFHPENVKIVDYEGLQARKGALLDEISAWVGGLSNRNGAVKAHISGDDRVSLPNSRVSAIKEMIEKLDWEYYTTNGL